MNRWKEEGALAAQQLGLPGEVFGLTRVEITGDTQVLVSGHRGIRSYGPAEIVVEMGTCALEVTGEELGIRAMTRGELLLAGRLAALRFLR